ncbi:hypothetical protein AWB81_08429 [Caballeronia arationis]|nr:hypothetical protein AWB81_08429 [Caballeronia arationis]
MVVSARSVNIIQSRELLGYHLISLVRPTASHERPYRTDDGDPVLKTDGRAEVA